MNYLYAAYAVIWAGVGLYLARLSLMRRALERRLERLEGSLGSPEESS
ncbi:MAG: CcmD family protein [bacterium]|nr:MAG: CcmD family protein [bacterium]